MRGDQAVERGIVACLFLKPEILIEVRESLRPSMFTDPACRRVFKHIVHLCDTGTTVDAVTVGHRCSEDMGWLATACEQIVSPIAIHHYVKVVSDIHRRMVLAEACQAACYMLATSEPIEKCIAEIADGLAMASLQRSKDVAVAQAAEEVMNLIQSQRPTMYVTGIKAFDDLFGGVYQQGVNTFVGRSASGKTSLAMQVALSIAFQGVPVRVFSREQDAVSLAANALGVIGQAPYSTVMRRGGKLLPSQVDAAKSAIESMRNIDMAFVEESLSAEQVYDRCTVYAARGVKCVVIDYIQAMPGSQDSEEQRVNNAAWTIQKIHRDLGMCVILVSQMTASASRENRPPRINDCSGGHAIENITTMGVGTYRPVQWEVKTADMDNREWERRCAMAQLVILKNKHGPSGVVDVRFEGMWTKFLDWR